jgi:uncharacterized membrane protein YidH (DUF202 family)
VKWTLIAGGVLLVALAVAIVSLTFYVLSRLKEYHPNEWRELGSPSLLTNNSIKNNLAVLKFLKSGEYSRLNDPKLTIASRLLWHLSAIYLVILAVAIFLLLMTIAMPEVAPEI